MIGRRPRASLVVATVLAVAAGGTLLGNSLATGDSGPGAARAKARAPKVVARVSAVSGARLYVKQFKGGKVVRLVKGGKVYLHDIVAVGPGGKATLKLLFPKGLSANADMLNIYRHRVTGKPRAKTVVKEFAILPPVDLKRPSLDHTLKLSRSGDHLEALISA